jgi:hypothetical protein
MAGGFRLASDNSIRAKGSTQDISTLFPFPWKWNPTYHRSGRPAGGNIRHRILGNKRHFWEPRHCSFSCSPPNSRLSLFPTPTVVGHERVLLLQPPWSRSDETYFSVTAQRPLASWVVKGHRRMPCIPRGPQ